MPAKKEFDELERPLEMFISNYTSGTGQYSNIFDTGTGLSFLDAVENGTLMLKTVANGVKLHIERNGDVTWLTSEDGRDTAMCATKKKLVEIQLGGYTELL